MRARRPRKRELATFALIVLIAEVAGTSATRRVDGALHVAPLAPSGASYYPFLLVAAKIAGALALAALLARATRAHAAADAGHRLLAAVGHASERRTPRLRPTLSLRVWLASFGATSLLYLVHVDAEGLADGRWPLLAPWLHTYALPVFAALSVLAALAWGLARWLHAVEAYAERTIARAHRLLSARRRARAAFARARDDAAPRRRFGLSFESRPPPLAA
ncbi:MAG TPA: hypothetical protein VFA05_02300 [Gaiellaceae bacterium]|nr:hypothetical protein [Gaiellaceae bacterium]